MMFEFCMILDYILTPVVQNLVGLILLIATILKIVLHFKILPQQNNRQEVNSLFTNLIKVGIMKPVSGRNSIIKIINICVCLFYLCLIVIFSQWFVK